MIYYCAYTRFLVSSTKQRYIEAIQCTPYDTCCWESSGSTLYHQVNHQLVSWYLPRYVRGRMLVFAFKYPRFDCPGRPLHTIIKSGGLNNEFTYFPVMMAEQGHFFTYACQISQFKVDLAFLLFICTSLFLQVIWISKKKYLLHIRLMANK